MKKSNFYLTLVILLFLSTNCLLAQDTNLFNNSKHRIGFIVGFGGQNVNQLLSDINVRDAELLREFIISKGLDSDELGLAVQYDYQVKFFQAQYYWAFVRRQTWGLDLLVQPQYNVTKFRHIDNISNEINGFELGVNVGVLIRKNIFKDFLSIYAFISSGPHYVSGTPQRQSDGFIFSISLISSTT